MPKFTDKQIQLILSKIEAKVLLDTNDINKAQAAWMATLYAMEEKDLI